MSDEQRKDDEVEGHWKKPLANDELSEGDESEVESHWKKPLASDELSEEGEDDEVEGHLRRHGNARMD